jgi:hypothetical protein
MDVKGKFKEWEWEWRRTHLRENAGGCIYGTPEGRQGQEGALEDKVDERVKRLLQFHDVSIFWAGEGR